MECKNLGRSFSLSEIITFYVMFSVILAKAYGSTASTTPNHISTKFPRTSEKFTEIPDEYDVPDFLKIGTEYCEQKSICSGRFHKIFPDKNCHCDLLCRLLDDCCKDYGYETESTLKKDQFSCVPLYEIVKNKDFGVTMVTKCSSEWKHEATKRLCEEKLHSDDIFLTLPVSDHSDLSVMYRNMYCAQCNFVFTFEYWKPEMKCVNETGVRSLPEMTDCVWFYIKPRPEVAHRTCQLQPPITTTCSETSEETFTKINDNCTSGVYDIVYDTIGTAYRNRYCATCNGVHTDLYCEQIRPSIPPDGTPTTKPRKVYSFRLLVDFNEGTVSQNELTSDLQMCNDNEKYDSFSQKCREIFCAPPSLAISGSCVLNSSMGNNESDISLANCTLVKLDPAEYKLTNTSQLFVFSDGKTYTEEEFKKVGSDVYICLHNMERCLYNCSKSDSLFQFDVAETYLTLVGLILSIVSLAITLAVYAMFKQLLNIPGKILVCLIVSLLLAQLFFLISAEFEHIAKLCLSIAVLVHYFYLAAFCWMNVIAFDMWMTFSNQFVPHGSRRNRMRFLKYSLYGWATPLLIVCSAVVLDFIKFDEYRTLKPGYGQGVCWITSKNALLLFFAGPLALFKFFDVVSFIFTAIHIARAKKQGAMARQKNTCSFIINLKLSLIMGLTWVFAFVANFLNTASMWYLFILFNSLQGLFIAICFLCTRKVGRLLRDRRQKFSTKSTFGTRLSSLS